MDEKQKEVWDVVLTYTNLIMNGKIDEFIEHFHEDYSGWSNIEPIPTDKQSIVSELNNRPRIQVIEQYNIIPIKIKIHDKIAVVHYFLKEKVKGQESVKESYIKHYTDVLINNNDRWYLIADHFGIQENEIFKYYKEG